ncbi:MAG: enoyl-CoA hydratase/isomerase family protein [Onishia taeanensis]|uniref:enoyl-CoA hydratase/isomerase family protein n=1 Tax=Onishia taeanensis TaxID=284577 RepID=UPI003C7A6A61
MQNKEALSTDAASPVDYQRHGRVGVIRIANPPVNALSQAVRQGLVDALRQALDDNRTEVIILMAAGRTFIAGADIREFGKPPQAPVLSEVIAALEASDKPLVAVLHGTALGGGLEVALGCHLRIALAGTRVGLPEVKLGLLPGAGGTQRLPRLAGVEVALDMITSGRFVDADEALSHGIIDDVASGDDPLTVGLEAAETLLQGGYAPRRTGHLPAPTADHEACERHRQRLTRDEPYLFSPFRCVDAVEAAMRLPLVDGLARERELFVSCMDSPQRAGMIHAFFAARGTHKVPGIADVTSLTRLGLIGEHPLFEELAKTADRAGVALIHLDDQGHGTGRDEIEACLLASDLDAPRDQPLDSALPRGTLRIRVTSPEGDSEERGDDFQLVLSPLGVRQPTCELVDLAGNPAAAQSLANTFKSLKRLVVATKGNSVMRSLEAALKDTLKTGDDAPLGAWQAEGWDLSPWYSGPIDADAEALAEARDPLDLAWQQAATRLSQAGWVHRDSDIDVLAIHAFGYPAHLGGPAFRSHATRQTCPVIERPL